MDTSDLAVLWDRIELLRGYFGRKSSTTAEESGTVLSGLIPFEFLFFE
jgi:hypothetical protein